MPEADRHDTSSIYRKLTLPQLQKEVPQINWNEYLQATLGPNVRLDPNEPIVSYGMPYMVQMGKILAATDRKTVHNYVIWRLVMSIMTHMIDDFQRVFYWRSHTHLSEHIIIFEIYTHGLGTRRLPQDPFGHSVGAPSLVAVRRMDQ